MSVSCDRDWRNGRLVPLTRLRRPAPHPEDPRPTDAVIRTVAACVCGSDLWDYRGINDVAQPTPIGHEYVGVVEETGAAVKDIKPGQFVIGSFSASDNTCPVADFPRPTGPETRADRGFVNDPRR